LPELNPAWWRYTDDEGRVIRYIWDSTPVVCGTRVYAAGYVLVDSVREYKMYAFSRNTGATVWTASLPPLAPALDSQSSPALDFLNKRLVVAWADQLIALSMEDGALAWTTQLAGTVVNACPALTDDLGPGNRAFITDYDGLGQTAQLYCINIDPFDASANPYQPGAVVWAVPIGGSSGNSPAYLPRRQGGVGLVYVPTIGLYNVSGGQVFAFKAGASAPIPQWTATLPVLEGFFGGLGVRALASGRVVVLGSTYNFFGGVDNSTTVCLDGATGWMIDAIKSNRTNTTPVPIGDERMVMSGGIAGGQFCSAPTLKLCGFEDLDFSVVWDTYADLNANNCADEGEYAPVGGWRSQPAVSIFGGCTRIAAGEQAAGVVSARAVKLRTIAPGYTPAESGWEEDSNDEAGGCPALAGANVYSIGDKGLVAFGPSPQRFDTEGDGDVDRDDLSAWERGFGILDVDGDGDTDSADRFALVTLIRHREAGELTEGRY
jgi:outer membrane protein assembly factor BamB